MKYLVIFLFSCSVQASTCYEAGKSIQSKIYHVNYVPYDLVKKKIAADRLSLKRNHIAIDSCRNYFLDAFEKDVFPHWVGTIWDYNGYTNVPGPDKYIACGYFVSTPLKHMGFNWNRYKLAQMYSKDIVDTLCPDMTHYQNKEEMILELKSREDHLYICGLDNHVGMLLKRNEQVFFVHSNYLWVEGPVKEWADSSKALSYSESYYVGTFTTDENLQKWMDGTVFPTE